MLLDDIGQRALHCRCFDYYDGLFCALSISMVLRILFFVHQLISNEFMNNA